LLLVELCFRIVRDTLLLLPSKHQAQDKTRQDKLGAGRGNAKHRADYKPYPHLILKHIPSVACESYRLLLLHLAASTRSFVQPARDSGSLSHKQTQASSAAYRTLHTPSNASNASCNPQPNCNCQLGTTPTRAHTNPDHRDYIQPTARRKSSFELRVSVPSPRSLTTSSQPSAAKHRAQARLSRATNISTRIIISSTKVCFGLQ
jgi:hypothetical protein